MVRLIDDNVVLKEICRNRSTACAGSARKGQACRLEVAENGMPCEGKSSWELPVSTSNDPPCLSCKWIKARRISAWSSGLF